MSTNITKNFFAQSSIKENDDTRAIMDYLTTSDSINRMIVASDLGLPAITPIVKGLEEKFGDCKLSPLNHNGKNHNALHRQNIGRMVKYIMGQFGYVPVDGGLSDRARIPKCSGSSFFSSAAVYSKLKDDKYSKYSITVEIIKNQN